VIETRSTEVELQWRPSPLTRAVVTCAAAALAVALIGGYWQLVAFTAPLVGVLVSIGWQREVPRVHVHAEPGSHRCFESEETRVSVWAVAETNDVAVGLTLEAVRGMRLETVDRASQRQTVAVAADKWGRYPILARVKVVARGGLLLGTGVSDAADVFVFPLVSPQSTAIPRTELLNRLGTHLTRHIGPGVEYADVRRYVPGDQLRAVNWPVSARRGSLHVTERLTDRAADVVVLIDGYPQPPGPATEATDRVVRGAVQVVQSALRAGDRATVESTHAGTINVIVVVNRPLARGAMVEAVQIATEARVLAVLAAGIKSVRSGAPATGTGTDCIAIAAPLRARARGARAEPYCGKHTLLGELVGRAVLESCARAIRGIR